MSSAPSAREGDYDKHDGKSINRTRLVGGLWISNSRLLCLVMALDLMTMTVQVRRRDSEGGSCVLIEQTQTHSFRQSREFEISSPPRHGRK